MANVTKVTEERVVRFGIRGTLRISFRARLLFPEAPTMHVVQATPRHILRPIGRWCAASLRNAGVFSAALILGAPGAVGAILTFGTLTPTPGRRW